MYYNYPATRWERAINAYHNKFPTYDCTGDIYFSFYTPAGTSIMPDGNPLFIHEQPHIGIIEELGS